MTHPNANHPIIGHHCGHLTARLEQATCINDDKLIIMIIYTSDLWAVMGLPLLDVL